MRNYKCKHIKTLSESGFFGVNDPSQIQIQIPNYSNNDRLFLLFGNPYKVKTDDDHHWQNFWQLEFFNGELVNIISSCQSVYIFGDNPNHVSDILLEIY
jgi:hypothetical protein